MTILPHPFPSSSLFSILIFIVFLTTAASHCNPCPSHCGKLHNVAFPFGSTLSCGLFDFQLSCDYGAATILLPPFGDVKAYEVLAITRNDYVNGSFVIRNKAMSSCSNVHPAGGLASQQIHFKEFRGAELSVSPNLIVLIFNCSNTKLRDSSFDSTSGFTYNTPACRAFYTACLETLNLPSTCFQSTTMDANFEFLSDAYQCSSYTSFYNVPLDLPASWPSQSDTGIHLQWVNAYNASACKPCMRSNGFCGVGDAETFQCLHSRSTFSCIKDKFLEGVPIYIITSIVLACIATLIALIYAVYRIRKAIWGSPTALNADGLPEKPHEYSYAALLIATKLFGLKLGEGGFGKVYKGVLPNGYAIAVKVLDGSKQGDKQFENEVASIGSIHHVNLVRLVGFCSRNSKRILVYEYLVNSSLDKHLFSENTDLGWQQRYSIAVGTARGLSYLHQECRKRIIHCDIKPGNILLDGDFNPKIGDFGLAKLMNQDESQALTAVRGTPGYVAPEFWSGKDGPVTEKCDVYSFGMLLFEIVGGRKNMDLKVSISQLYFPEWAFNQVAKRKHEVLQLLVDKRIDGAEIDLEQLRVVSLVALWCIQEEASLRPRMRKVVQYLERTQEVPDDPPCPFNSSSKNGAVTRHDDGLASSSSSSS